MPDTVKVPLLGTMNKRVLIFGGLAGVLVGGYWVWRRNQENKAADTGAYAYGYGSTFYGYGQGADFYGGDGGVQPYPVGSEYGYGAFGYGYYNPYTGQWLGTGTGTGPTSGPTPTAPATNLEWVRQASSALPGKGHRAALLRYIGGLPLNSDQQRVVREALGLLGDPPKTGPNGYPPKWHASQHPGQNGHHIVIANGHQTLWQIANTNNDSEAKVVRLNPNLAHYVG